jgi:hypothetical protein
MPESLGNNGEPQRNRTDGDDLATREKDEQQQFTCDEDRIPWWRRSCTWSISARQLALSFTAATFI